MSERLTSEIGRPEFYRMSQKLERLMGEKKGLIPNVDFYSATVYNALGIPDDLFTPIFAASRVAGWCAHVMEQYENNRIYRPRARYIGRTDARYEPIDHVSSHGALHAAHMMVPLLGNRRLAETPRRTADLHRLLLDALGFGTEVHQRATLVSAGKAPGV